MTVTLTMNEETANIVARATEFYSRVMCGQYELLTDCVMDARGDHLGTPDDPQEREWRFAELQEQQRRAEAILIQTRHEQFPELAPEMGSHWGLGYSRQTDIAYNVYQAIRYGFAWNREPAGGIGISFDLPSAKELPYPAVEIDGKVYLTGNMGDGSTDQDRRWG